MQNNHIMGFSTGAGSLQSRTSTISPEVKSSSNSSIEKKLSPRNKPIKFLIKPENTDQFDGPASIKKALQSDLNN